MKLSSFLLFPTERIKSSDGLTLTTFDTHGIHDDVAQEYLRMLVNCASLEEARMIMTLLYQAWSDGEIKCDIDKFYAVEK